jgi:acyl carrier protein
MSTTREPIEQQIRDFIARNLLFSGEGFPYSDDASLLEEGIIDSLGIMQLVEFAQQAFDVAISQQEVIPEHFDSVSKLSAFVRGKLQARAPAAQR